MLADDFVLAGGPRLGGKREYIADVVNAAPAPRTVAGSPPPMEHTRAFGDVVVVSGEWASKVSPTARFAITEIFACRGGQWVAVHGHYNTLPASTAADSLVLAAQAAQRGGRGAEARGILERGAAGATDPEVRLCYQLLVGDSYLYDGDLPAARQAYAAVAQAAEAAGVTALVSTAHYGVALTEALAGWAREAEAYFADSRRAGGWSVDAAGVAPAGGAVMIHALLGRVHSAAAALQTAEREGYSVQCVRAFRGLALAMAGRCVGALQAAGDAPNQDGPAVVAVRAHCAAAAGRQAEARAARDRVLAQPPEDPLLWSYHIARHVVRQIP